MKCNKCGIDVPSSYLKCPSCGAGFNGANSSSSFNIPAQNPTHFASTTIAPQHAVLSPSIPCAPISSRFFALLIDSLIIIVPAALLGAFVGLWGSFFDDNESITVIKAQLVGYLIWIIYEALFLSGPWMATPGKKLLSIKVTDINGQQISFWRAVGRAVGQFISSIFFIGYIMAFFTKNKQALHDLMAGTIVIKD